MDSVVMGGSATVNPEDLTKGVADIFLEDVLEPRAAPGAAGTPPPSPSGEPIRQRTGRQDRPLSRGAGRKPHRADLGPRWQAQGCGISTATTIDLLMTPISPNRFLPGATLEFSPAEAGRPRAWHSSDGGGQRVVELPSVEFEWRRQDSNRSPEPIEAMNWT